MSAQELIIVHLDLWTGAVKKKSSSGRGSNGKVELTGIKKLRELILELAVRGKLVEQDPNEEPAEALVEKIAKKRAEFLRARTTKKSVQLPQISREGVPFEAPDGWHWIRLGELTEKIGSGATPRGGKGAYVESGIPFLRSQNIWNNGFNLQDVAYIPSETHGRMSNTHVFPNDILLNITGASLGRCTIAPSDLKTANVSQHVTIIRTIDPLNRRYLHYLILSPYVQSMIWGRQVGMAREGLSKKVLEQFEIPLPPLGEQHRIVQKVDELMALCDRLEQHTSDQLEAHETLVDTLLDILTQSENATELADNWARLAAHFDTLFTTEQSINKLKHSILHLAVTGRLARQDAGDESAAALLQSIENEKAELTKSGAMKRIKHFPPVSLEEHPFRLPNGWRCYRLGALVSKLGSGSTPRGGQRAYVDEGIPFLRSQNVWNDGLRLEDIVYISEDTHARMSNTIVYPQDILLNITGASLGRSTIFPDRIPEANVSQHVTIIRLIEPAMTSFVHLCIKSPLIQSLVWGRQVGMAIEGLSKKVLERFEMPIPPLAEQRRIVQKVDELMALCDQLKERLNQTSDTRCQLAETVVEGALK
ncbi:MAG: restriction endonuclease subunit S [Haliea sp.]|nr:restriction endonuclease subunit S [Haliea sp.]